MKSIANRTGANGTFLSHKEKNKLLCQEIIRKMPKTSKLGLYTKTRSIITLVNTYYADVKIWVLFMEGTWVKLQPRASQIMHSQRWKLPSNFQKTSYIKGLILEKVGILWKLGWFLGVVTFLMWNAVWNQDNFNFINAYRIAIFNKLRG